MKAEVSKDQVWLLTSVAMVLVVDDHVTKENASWCAVRAYYYLENKGKSITITSAIKWIVTFFGSGRTELNRAGRIVKSASEMASYSALASRIQSCMDDIASARAFNAKKRVDRSITEV